MDALDDIPLWQQIFGWLLCLAGCTGLVVLAGRRFRRQLRRDGWIRGRADRHNRHSKS